MPRNRFSLFAPKDTIDINDQTEQSLFNKLQSLLTTHSSGWVTANQAFNMLNAAAAGYLLATRPNAIFSLALPEFITHISQGLYVSSDNPSTQDKLFLLNALNILYSTCYHLAHQHSDLSLATAMTELLAAHFMGNIWMNIVQANQSGRQHAERGEHTNNLTHENDPIPAIMRLT